MTSLSDTRVVLDRSSLRVHVVRARSGVGGRSAVDEDRLPAGAAFEHVRGDAADRQPNGDRYLSGRRRSGGGRVLDGPQSGQRVAPPARDAVPVATLRGGRDWQCPRAKGLVAPRAVQLAAITGRNEADEGSEIGTITAASRIQALRRRRRSRGSCLDSRRVGDRRPRACGLCRACPGGVLQMAPGPGPPRPLSLDGDGARAWVAAAAGGKAPGRWDAASDRRQRERRRRRRLERFLQQPQARLSVSACRGDAVGASLSAVER